MSQGESSSCSIPPKRLMGSRIMFEGALFGVALLVILGALMGLLNWLFDHKRAIGSALIVVPILFPRIVLCCERQGAEQ